MPPSSRTSSTTVHHGRSCGGGTPRRSPLRPLSGAVHVHRDLFPLAQSRVVGAEHHLRHLARRRSRPLAATKCGRRVVGLLLPATAIGVILHHSGRVGSNEHQGNERFVWGQPAFHRTGQGRRVITRFRRERRFHRRRRLGWCQWMHLVQHQRRHRPMRPSLRLPQVLLPFFGR